jgi:hypothetical protein
MTEILAVGTSSASSADFTVVAGAKCILQLKNATGPNIGSRALVYVDMKIGTLYFVCGFMDGANPNAVIDGSSGTGSGTVTYRCRRVGAASAADTDPVGVERV